MRFVIDSKSEWSVFPGVAGWALEGEGAFASLPSLLPEPHFGVESFFFSSGRDFMLLEFVRVCMILNTLLLASISPGQCRPDRTLSAGLAS